MRRIGLLRNGMVLAAALLALAIDDRAVADPSFAVPIFVYTTEAEPIRSVVYDIDADGRQDVAVLDRAGRAFEIFRGAPGNHFTRGAPIRMINDPACLVPGDFDADGRIDFLVPGTYQLGRVLVNRGAGVFDAVEFSISGPIGAAVAARFDSDAHLDAVLLRPSDGALFLLRGNGQGGMTTPFLWAQSQIGSSGLAAGDFDADGYTDLAVAGPATHLFFGGADGQLTDPLPLPGTSRCAAVADLNGDGHLDLIAAGDEMRVHLGRGDRTFDPPQVYSAPGTLRAIALADMNHDGRLDVLRVPSAIGGIAVRMGGANGTFGSEAELPLGNLPLGLATGDLDADGDIDIAVTTPQTNALRLLMNSGDGTIGRRRYTMGRDPRGLAAADWNGDGALDVMATNGAAHTLTLRLGTGDGALGDAITIPLAGRPQGLAAGDLNADGWADVAVRDDSAQAVRTYLGHGDGRFVPAGVMPCANLRLDLQLHDLDADGNLDVVGISPGDAGALDLVGVLRGTGDGSLQPAYWFETRGNPVALAVGDIDGSGAPDLAAACRTDASVSLLLANGDATFYAAKFDPETGVAPGGIAIGDVDRDGNPDLVVGHAGWRGLSIHQGDGHGEFAARRTLETETEVQDVRLVDLDLDGDPDIVASRPAAGIVSMWTNQGGGTFGQRNDFGLGRVESLLFLRLDADPLPDLVMTEADRGEVVILVNTSVRTPIRIHDFEAAVTGGVVRLTWRSADWNELPGAGIAVQRAPASDGPWSQRSPQPLPLEPRMAFEELWESATATLWYRLVWLAPGGGRQVLAIREVAAGERSIRTTLGLPVNLGNDVRIPFVLAAPLAVRLAVYDVRGRRVWELQRPRDTAGEHTVIWDGRDARGATLGRGVYIVRLEAGGLRAERKLVRVHR